MAAGCWCICCAWIISPMPLPITFVKFTITTCTSVLYRPYWWIGGGVSWWIYYQCWIQTMVYPFTKNVSVAVTGSTSISNSLLFLSLGSICVASMANSKNNYQSSFWKLALFIIISFKHTLNSFDHIYIGHNYQPWQLCCRHLRLPSGIPHGGMIFLLAEMRLHFNGVAPEFHLWPFPWLITWHHELIYEYVINRNHVWPNSKYLMVISS